MLVSQVFRVEEGAAQGAEVAPGHLLVEARAAAAEGAHIEAAQAVGALARGLKAYTAFRPLPPLGRTS